jgi:hypothetical protein
MKKEYKISMNMLKAFKGEAFDTTKGHQFLGGGGGGV